MKEEDQKTQKPKEKDVETENLTEEQKREEAMRIKIEELRKRDPFIYR